MSDQQEPVSFEDPLENYEPPTFDDPIEQALHDEPVSAIRAQPHIAIPADTTVGAALQQMVGQHIACLMVEDQGKLVGVFSDRDVLDKVALEYDAMLDRPVSEVMAADPVFVHDTDSAAAALAVVAVSGFRHVPVVDPENNIVGIVSPQRITQFLQSHFQKA